MVKVAVAGGTGGLGRTIVEALANSDHETVVLTREVCTILFSLLSSRLTLHGN